MQPVRSEKKAEEEEEEEEEEAVIESVGVLAATSQRQSSGADGREEVEQRLLCKRAGGMGQLEDSGEEDEKVDVTEGNEDGSGQEEEDEYENLVGVKHRSKT